MSDDGEPAPDDRTAPDATRSDGTERWVILNPTSGTADHVDDVRRLARERNYAIRETTHEEHAVQLAADAAASDVDRLAVAGGDGTLHEVVRGLAESSALGTVTLGAIPTGTENIFATTIGVASVEDGFDLLENGERRRIDVGFAGEEPFVVSCIAGLPAEVSVAASSELKERFGSLAFVVAGLRELTEFGGLHVDITAVSNGEETTWSGEALCVLVGNVRRFVNRGGPADVEDGLFDAVVIEQMPAKDVLAEATAHRVFGRDTDHVIHVQTSQLEIRGTDSEPITFSLDGEVTEADELVLYADPRSLTVCVGPTYEDAGPE
ncbi:diacylglycerol kinase family protein [Halorubrum sp. AD140]|uniref:diacylglycerol/lipid kinase family protein n=1 Tax=Halorubrum sp. AD140 TaxID=3050073 RepID=UPI002ACC55A3|nr:diacylglycerol kinase family protein [Halorubrum sp. AD140]MDZ5810600.1 diacylglycerol kinase family protein [Halorubrum sp. AD140]